MLKEIKFNSMKIKSLRSHTALIEIEKKKKSESGVFYAESTHINESAKVLKIANDVTDFKEGDRILFKAWAVNKYEVDGQEFAIIDDDKYDAVLS